MSITLLLFVLAFLFNQADSSGGVAQRHEAYPPLAAAEDGRPQAAAHYLPAAEDGKIRLAVQVLAPGAGIEAFRIDNLGGQSSLWRSDVPDSEAGAIAVTRQGQTLTDGTGKMNFGPLGAGEELLELTLADNGAFKEQKTDFRVTVFFTGGARAFCLLKGADQMAALAEAPPVPAGETDRP